MPLKHSNLTILAKLSILTRNLLLSLLICLLVATGKVGRGPCGWHALYAAISAGIGIAGFAHGATIGSLAGCLIGGLLRSDYRKGRICQCQRQYKGKEKLAFHG